MLACIVLCHALGARADSARHIRWAGESAPRAHSSRRRRSRVGRDRRRARRGGVAVRGGVGGLLSVFAAGRRTGGRFDASASVVLEHRAVRGRARVRDARRRARDARRPRQDLGRRQRAAVDRHVPRPAPGVRVRGQSTRRADGRNARRERIGRARQLDADARRARVGGSEPGLRLRVEGAPDRVRLRGRDAHSVQEPEVSVRGRADVGPERRARGAAFRLRGQLGAGASHERVLPRAVGNDRGTHAGWTAVSCST